jgi:PIN domain nuclease of toxin-antitoxin system
MAALVSDTHSAIWYLHDDKRLSLTAERAMDEALQNGDHIYIPSICLVEVTYLVEKGRVARGAMERLEDALADRSFGFTVAVLDLAVARALQRIPRDQVPDLPDRVIAATALALDMPLVTRDAKIRAANILTIW